MFIIFAIINFTPNNSSDNLLGRAPVLSNVCNDVEDRVCGMFVTSRKVPDMISSVPGAEFLLRTNFGLG